MRARELFGANIFPRHQNVSAFKAKEDFVSVGIGPLSFDTRFVEKGDPDERLTGDALFLAQALGVKKPPMPVSDPVEKKMFNDKLSRRPKPTESDFANWSEQYLRDSDCKRIFPKHPLMLHAHYKKSKETAEIKACKAMLGKDYNEFIAELNRRKVPSSDAGGAEVADLVADQMEQPTAEAVMHVPSLVAAGQTAYVSTKVGSRPHQDCYYYPFCKQDANVCRGIRKGKCRAWLNGELDLPTDEAEFQEKKAAAKLAKRAAAVRETRAKQK